ncbi:hypothetical protein ENUP19_0018G0054 [Entamoeba nuttalli]|uniref:MAM domain-containing protein n=2 Tax=Entamoeba nuttalli TaxID=412467 RepID=K2HHX2_ENTNP|nr:hypothetical protein ENU1_016820 [Entamoeba nuttalli P19]EKE42574.1 hypothetical protein ENU1_016820 [Entamoeba nuttalli P19]|eukprot:XP_008855091.1 hypothetical protein ENU1_016820 [Entamoeba nuttalli P19]
MNTQYLAFACVISVALANYTVFSDGVFKNNWYEKDSSCFASQTGKYDGRYILYTQMATSSFLNLHGDKPIIAKNYKYLTFALNWEDQFCNLRITVELGSHWLKTLEFQPEVLEPQKWNRVVVDITSLGDTDVDTIRITKNDQKDTNVMFNDFIFTNDEPEGGVFSYEQLSSSIPLDDSEINSSMPVFILLLGMVFLFL